MTNSTAIHPRHAGFDGVLIALACLVAAGGFLVHPITWLVAG
jgi:hypothetical protein